MKTLVVHCYPDSESINAALFRAGCKALHLAGNDLTTLDLYAEPFDPVMTLEEWRANLSNPELVKTEYKNTLMHCVRLNTWRSFTQLGGTARLPC